MKGEVQQPAMEAARRAENRRKKEQKRKKKMENKKMQVEAKDDICWRLDSKSEAA